jgi:hypothetical protein
MCKVSRNKTTPFNTEFSDFVNPLVGHGAQLNCAPFARARNAIEDIQLI